MHCCQIAPSASKVNLAQQMKRIVGLQQAVTCNNNIELMLISATMLVQSFFFAKICVQPVWCMPSKMVNGLRVTQPLKKNIIHL
jgi:hypothetical protein